jgi:hypothetical protein
VAEPASQRPDLEYGTRLALVIIGGPSTCALVILWGVALALFGLAVKAEGYPAWLSWAGVGAGATVFVLGAVQYLAPNHVFPGALFYGGGTTVSQIWTIVFGLAMWRRGVAHEPIARTGWEGSG